jgi:hypothetical protein
MRTEDENRWTVAFWVGDTVFQMGLRPTTTTSTDLGHSKCSTAPPGHRSGPFRHSVLDCPSAVLERILDGKYAAPDENFGWEERSVRYSDPISTADGNDTLRAQKQRGYSFATRRKLPPVDASWPPCLPVATRPCHTPPRPPCDTLPRSCAGARGLVGTVD